MPKFIEKPGAWIVRALGLRPGEAPSTLADDVSPVVDAFGQGAAATIWTFVAHNFPAGTAANGNFDLLALPVPEHQDRIVRFSLFRLGGAGTIESFIQLRLIDTSALRVWTEPALATPIQRSWWSLSDGADWLFVPAGWKLQFSHPLMAAGESMGVRLQVGTAPKGFKLW